MAGARITLTFFGETQVDRTLERFSLHAQDARPAWEAITENFLRLERRQFSTQGGYSGGWTPLSPPYARWKAQHFPGKTILRRTDTLWRSLTVGPAVRVLEPDSMIIGSDVEYGRYHQAGDGLPRRRPVDVPESRRREWVKILQRFIVTGEA